VTLITTGRIVDEASDKDYADPGVFLPNVTSPFDLVLSGGTSAHLYRS